MKPRSAMTLLISVALVCPSQGFAERPSSAGRLAAEGKAHVNSVLAPAGTTVFYGDTISVDNHGLATITLAHGNRVLIAQNSSAQLERDGEQTGVRIAHGTVAVMSRGKAGVQMNALGLSIRPATASPTSYAARIEDRAVVLTSVTGDVRVEGLTSTHLVPSGKSMRFELDYPQGPVGAGSGTGVSTVVKVVIVTAFVAAVAVPTILYNTGKAVSP